MQSRKSSFALSIVKGAAVMFVLLSSLATFAGTNTTYTENTLYSFGTYGEPDGSQPGRNGLVMDKAGNLYGTTNSAICGLNEICLGAVFELSPNGSGGWTETVLHIFDPLSTTNPNDGAYPTGSLAIDSKGNLYGTCMGGGPLWDTGNPITPYQGSGIVWELSPPTVAGDAWTETILYSFGAQGSGDGYNPYAGVTPASAAATTLYGTTECGGSGPATFETCQDGSGTVYQLTYVKKTKTVPAHWVETILHNFVATDGAAPLGGLLLSGGSLYGYTSTGGATYQGPPMGHGVVYELKPNGTASTYNVLYNFGASATDAAGPYYGAPVIDAEKNLYGTSMNGGSYANGAVWELAYSATDATYTEQVIYSFSTDSESSAGVNWGLVYSKGSLFGSTDGWSGPGNGGTVFELTYKKPTAKVPGGWTETDIYDFPASVGFGSGWNQLILDSAGNFYGMLPGLDYGAYPYGSVFELSPSAE
jgi:hypothetical protein